VIPEQSLNEAVQDKSEFFHLQDRASDHPFVEKVWRCHADRGDTFLSIAANSFEMVFTRLRGKSFLTLRGPETVATPFDCPADGQWVGIRFKPGTFMPRFLPGSLRDHNDVTLPPATGQSFWLNASRAIRLLKTHCCGAQENYPCVPHNATFCNPRASRTLRSVRSNEHDMQRSCSGRESRSWMWLAA
jgi:hypothetical protein